MAVGNLIYVGKSRLRRKYRQQKIDNRIKRQERRKSLRLEREVEQIKNRQNESPEPKDDTDNNNNGNQIGGEDYHCCRFCDDCNSLDCISLQSGSSGADSEDLLPLIDTLSLRPIYDKMPFSPFNKKKDAKDKTRPRVSAPVQETPVESPAEKAAARTPEKGAVEPPAYQREPEPDVVSAQISLLLEVERRLKEKEDRLKELEEQYVMEKQKLAEQEAKTLAKAAEYSAITDEIELQSKPMGNGGMPSALEEVEQDVQEASSRTPLLKKNLQGLHPGKLLCCTIM